VFIGLESSLLARGAALFEGLGSVVSLEDPRCHACVVRATVNVGAEFLRAHPSLRYVATASSGFDHMDLGVLSKQDVRSYVARGCNAEAVADWVQLALHAVGVVPKLLGVVGVGHAGSAVARRFPGRALLCDPPREKRDMHFKGVALERIFEECDVVTLHVPLTDATHPLIGPREVGLLRAGTLVNASRGDVLDAQAGLTFVNGGGTLCLDVFPGEPDVDLEYIRSATFTTPHIAGHTVDAKNRALEMCADWLASELGLPGQGRAGFPPVHEAPLDTLQRADRDLRAGDSFQAVRARSVRQALERTKEHAT
jgi:erythronate-4-phosphate dehydrogenase